ncbi:thioredoxin family protein [Flammeovirga sp. MY04]|uniref:thioredoxin family protein n=1 Tax=Flammeovirga sp. MY04 TaxID=1191459 RepID=UPI0008061C43|nr:thioredoxin family protein [Flammeovirga sp. MY04]ANQ47702.1 thioredoxin family protein [Flammeovirga sp. MY04]
MKKIIQSFTLSILLTLSFNCFAQTETYDPSADAMKDIQSAVKTASKEGKHVFVKVGGNWCGWCKKYAKFTHEDAEISKLMEDYYVKVLVNWSNDNKNPEAMKYLGNPQRFGYPVFVILDGHGKVIHIQNSAYLESGKGYDKNKVMMFLKGWTTTAIDPKTYN